jgi:2-polyprenyl-6-methoxyphenol hydroxylase-like FAD-dependent oxidoreductase
MKIVIVGAGIGGLAAALALQAEGRDIVVAEAVPAIRPMGVGINLLPQAARVLGEFGVLDELLALGVATRELSYYSARGQHIWTEPRGLFGGYQAPQVSLSRGQLQMSLLEAATERLGADRIRTGLRMVSVRHAGQKATVVFESAGGGEVTLEADIVVFADGIHSRARALLYPDEGPPVFSGRLLWRSTTMARPFLTGATMIMAGHEAQKFVCYPIEPPRADGLQRINWIAELKAGEMLRREDWNRAGNLSDFLPQFETWSFDWLDVPSLIRNAEQVFEYPMVDRNPVARWNEGCTTLLGDAAHAMYPIGSNGASQAILDAAALARALNEHRKIADALAAYEQERLPATSAIVLANRRNGPEQCMQMAHERAPNGFKRIEDVFAAGELQAIADSYKQLTGMRRAT